MTDTTNHPALVFAGMFRKLTLSDRLQDVGTVRRHPLPRERTGTPEEAGLLAERKPGGWPTAMGIYISPRLKLLALDHYKCDAEGYVMSFQQHTLKGKNVLNEAMQPTRLGDHMLKRMRKQRAAQVLYLPYSENLTRLLADGSVPMHGFGWYHRRQPFSEMEAGLVRHGFVHLVLLHLNADLHLLGLDLLEVNKDQQVVQAIGTGTDGSVGEPADLRGLPLAEAVQARREVLGTEMLLVHWHSGRLATCFANDMPGAYVPEFGGTTVEALAAGRYKPTSELMGW